jgi:hypothetical protein
MRNGCGCVQKSNIAILSGGMLIYHGNLILRITAFLEADIFSIPGLLYNESRSKDFCKSSLETADFRHFEYSWQIFMDRFEHLGISHDKSQLSLAKPSFISLGQIHVLVG